MAEIDAAGRTTREVNEQMKRLIAEGITDITVHNPGARHNLAVAVLTPVRIRIAGSAGYYGAGLNGGAIVDIAGSAVEVGANVVALAFKAMAFGALVLKNRLASTA